MMDYEKVMPELKYFVFADFEKGFNCRESWLLQPMANTHKMV
jgi:hypothetical protein